MARISDHPIRIARLKAGLSQTSLAQLAGVQRSALTALEDGRKRKASDKILGVLASQLDIPANQLEGELDLWWSRPLEPTLKPSAHNLLLIPPYTLSQYYRTFSDWRKEITPTQTAFASMLRINPAIIKDYESGKLQAMPDGLSAKMLEAFNLDVDYLVALEGLPRG